jgi:hypothetical protein
MFRAFLPNLMPVFVVYMVGRWRKPMRLQSETGRVIFWGSILSVVLLGIGMFASKAVGMRGRWFLPIYVWAPVLIAAEIKSVPRWLQRLVGSLAATGAIAVLLMLLLRNQREGGDRARDLLPETVASVASASGDVLRKADLIITDGYWSAGSMRLRFKRPVVTPSAPEAFRSTPGRIAIVFDAKNSETPSDELQAFVNKVMGRPVTLRVVHLTPGENRRRTGLPLGVAVPE